MSRTRNLTAGSSVVGGSAFLEMCEALRSPDLLPPTHPDGPRRMRDVPLPVSTFDPSIFTLAGDGVSRLPRGVTTR